MVDETTAADAEQEVAAEARQAAEAQATAELEGRARRMGWRPKEEFRGDPNRWTDAKSFIDRGETELPVLRERYRALDDRFAQLESRSVDTERSLTGRLKEMADTFQEFRGFAQRADERGYKRAKAELERTMAAAVETADKATFSAAKSELDQLESDRAAKPAPQAEARREETRRDERQEPQQRQQVHPDVISWVAENPWFNSDPAMANYAIAVHSQLQAERPGLSMRDNLAEVKADIVNRFPEKFANKKREEAAAVVTSQTTTPPKARKGKYPDFKDWPADAKAGYERFKKQMPDYKQEEYAKHYFAEGE